MDWDINNLPWRTMLQTLPKDTFKWRKENFTIFEVFTQEDHDEDSDKGYIPKVDDKYP